MAIIHTDNTIILTGDTAKSFSEKMKNPDKFLKECRESIEIIKGEKGKITLVCKELN